MRLLQIFRLCSHVAARLTFVFFATMGFAQTPAQIPYDHNPAAGRFYDSMASKCTPKSMAVVRRFS